MSTTTETPEVAEALEARIQEACDLAAGRTPADPSAEGHRIIGAEKDLNCKGRGPQYYRMVYRDGSWQYVSDDRLPSGAFRASDRRAKVFGVVFVGEIVASHDRGAQIGVAYLVVSPNPEEGGVLQKIGIKARRDGQLAFTLPDGSEIVTPNPRKR